MEINQEMTTDPVLSDREKVDLDAVLLQVFISTLGDKWQIVQDRMVDPISQIHMAQVSGRIVKVVSQLVATALQLWPKDDSRASDSESKKELQSNSSSSSAVTARPAHLQKYFELTEDTLVQSLGSLASQPSVRSMLGNVVKQLNQGLRVLSAESQDSTETEGSEVKSAAMKVLALACETLTEVTDNAAHQDIDAILDTATREVMFAVADSMSSCQHKERKSARILRDLASKATERHSESTELQSCLHWLGSSDQPESSAQSESDVHMKCYPLCVSSKKVSRDLAEFRSSCLQVLKGPLAKLLALFSPRSFSMMMSPHRPHLPTLESVASDILDIIVNGVKDICQKKKPRKLINKKTKVTEERVNSTATQVKVALQEKLREFLTCHRDAVEEGKKDQMSNQREKTEREDTQREWISGIKIIRGAVSTLLHQVYLYSDERDKSTLIKLEDLIREEKLSGFFVLLTDFLSPLSSSLVSPADVVPLFCEEAVKHLLRLFIFPPLSWGMGLVLRVQSSHEAAVRFKESAQLYDDIIGKYTQLMCYQVMNRLAKLLEEDNSEPQQRKKRKNIVHFFQKLPRKIQNNWRTPTNRMDTLSGPSVDEATVEDAEDEEGGGEASELRRRIVNVFQDLQDCAHFLWV